jgi:hypothetical protein
MTNGYGLDVDYFRKKLRIIVRDADRFTPEEMARALARLSVTAASYVLNEEEFSFQHRNSGQEPRHD